MPAEEGVSRPSSRWERILSKASVISGLSRWERRLRAYENELTDDNAGEREAVESLRDFALPIIQNLAALPSRPIGRSGSMRSASWRCAHWTRRRARRP